MFNNKQSLYKYVWNFYGIASKSFYTIHSISSLSESTINYSNTED